MSLSIYTIKHPLVMNWTNYILNNKLTESEIFAIINKIGMSLIYESTRNSITIQKLYLKKIDDLININILPKNFTCSIITDVYLSQILGKDIMNLIPLSTIHTIHYKKDRLNLSNLKLPDFSSDNLNNNKIIIVEQHLNHNKIIQLLDTMSANHKKQQDIQVCCMTCKTSTLQVLGTRYSNLNIYTTQIINDNNN